MKQKYEDTIFNSNVRFPVPIKKSHSKDYFIKIPIKEVGYISLNNLFLLLFYYFILGTFWVFLYKKHFIAVNLLTLINIFFSAVILLRDRVSGKNTLDIVAIIFRYMSKKNIGLLHPEKGDILSKNQRDGI